MANPEHVEILKQGVETWNKWREENPEIVPDLRTANFLDAYLKNVNLCNADCSNTNFSNADLYAANFSMATLNKTNFLRAILFGTNFNKANLYKADLTLTTSLETSFREANLKEVNFAGANLVRADLSKANLDGIVLFGTATDNWIIKETHCSNIYSDEFGENKLPNGRDFKEGEFEKLYTSLPSFEYIFENGLHPLDPYFMDRVVNEIKAKNSEFELEIDSISARGIKPSIKFTVKHEHKESAELAVRENYEKTITELETKKDELQTLVKQIGGTIAKQPTEQADKKNTEVAELKGGNNALVNVVNNIVGQLIDKGGIQINANQVTANSIGTHQGTQTWNLTQIDNSNKLDDDSKEWLKSVASQLQSANLDEVDQNIAQTKLEAFQSEIEKDQKDESKIKKTWDMLVALAPDIQKLSTLPDSVNKIIGPLFGG